MSGVINCDGMTREEFIRFARQKEVEWNYSEPWGRKIVWAYVGPWKCACGFETRDPAKLYDHRCPPVQGELDL